MSKKKTFFLGIVVGCGVFLMISFLASLGLLRAFAPLWEYLPNNDSISVIVIGSVYGGIGLLFFLLINRIRNVVVEDNAYAIFFIGSVLGNLIFMLGGFFIALSRWSLF